MYDVTRNPRKSFIVNNVLHIALRKMRNLYRVYRICIEFKDYVHTHYHRRKLYSFFNKMIVVDCWELALPLSFYAPVLLMVS